MVGNYLTSAIRALQRDKFHALLNIAGLSLSLSVTFLIALYIQYEFSYEDFFTEPDHVFLVETTFQMQGQEPISVTGDPYPVLELLEVNFGDQIVASYLSDTESVIDVGDRLYREEIGIVDPDFFEVLDFQLAHGVYDDLFDQPDKVILTESMAQELFGKTNAVGEYLQVNGQDFQVAAILKDIPANSVTSELKILASTASTLFEPSNFWTDIHGVILLRLKGVASASDIEAQLPTLIDRYMPDDQKQFWSISLQLVQFDRVNLLTGWWGASSNRNLIAVYIAAGMSLLLLLIASFNYINLSTARALLRTKEVGIRKILGAEKPQLVTRFLGEAVLTSMLSSFLALGIAAFFLPAFSVLVDRPLTISDLFSPSYLSIIGGISVCIGLLSGLYPALFLASAKPRDLFDNQKSATGKRTWLRSAIVGTQFSMTLGLIVVASVVFAQATYLRTLDLGFSKQGILVIPNMPMGEDAGLREAYNRALLDSPFIEVVSSSHSTPQGTYDERTRLQRTDGEFNLSWTFLRLGIDSSFFKVYGITPIITAPLFPNLIEDSAAFSGQVEGQPLKGRIIISESALTQMGYSSPMDAIGGVLIDPTFANNRSVEYEIIGVVSDVQYRLTEAPVVPMIYFYLTPGLPDRLGYTSVRVAPYAVQQALAHAELTWKSMFPDQPFEYEFLEDRIAEANADEQRQAQMFIYLTGLAIFVTCLGLFGLVSFVAARRTREVAIRKVLGATVGDLSRLLIWEFAKPILVANLIAWPVAWLLMRRWLDGFDSRIDLSPWFFVGASLLALIIALATVLSRIWKTTQTHPALALKYE